MPDRPRPAQEGDRVDVKVSLENGRERYLSGEVIRRFKYNDLSFTLHIRLGDNTPITLRYRHTHRFYVENTGDVIMYEVESQ